MALTKSKMNNDQNQSVATRRDTDRFLDTGVLFPRLFENFFDRDIPTLFTSMNRGNFPAVNVKETKDEFIADVAAPGMRKEDFRIRIDGNQLEISAEKEREQVQEDENYTRREYDYNSFTRYFVLPDSVDSNNINARYMDGILQLRIPKKEEAKPRPPRMIQIS